MQALFLVLHKVEKLDDLLAALQKSGINGGTIIEDPRETSKTLFFILKNEDVEKARTVIDKTLGGIDKPNTGIMFGIDLTFVAGLNIE